MSNKKISELSQLASSTVNELDLIAVMDVSASETKKITVQDLRTFISELTTDGLVPYTGAAQSVDLGEYGLKAGFYQYDLTPTSVPGDQGTTYWDDASETVALIMNGVTQKIGEDTFYHVKNETGSDIPKGTAVMFAGTDGASGKLLIEPFLADGTYPSEYFMGVTAEAINNGQNGKVYQFGKMRGINTHAYNDGDILYASTTSAGGFQNTKPSLPNNIISVAAVVRAANNGTLIIRPVIEGDTFSRLIYNGSNEAYSDRLKAGIGMSVDFLAPTPPSSPYAVPILNVDSSIVEFLSNKSTSVPTDAASNTKYPSVKAVYDWVSGLGYQKSTAILGYYSSFTVAISNSTTYYDLNPAGACITDKHPSTSSFSLDAAAGTIEYTGSATIKVIITAEVQAYLNTTDSVVREVVFNINRVTAGTPAGGMTFLPLKGESYGNKSTSWCTSITTLAPNEVVKITVSNNTDQQDIVINRFSFQIREL